MIKYFGIILSIRIHRFYQKTYQAKNKHLGNNNNGRLIDLRNAVNRKNIP